MSTYLAARLQLEDEIRRDPRLTPTARNVGMELIRRRGAVTGQCNISVPKIAAALQCGARSVDRALTQLEDAKWIERRSGKGRSSNHYLIPRLEARQVNGPGTGHDASSRQNGATTERLSRQNGATSEPLSRHFDGVVAPNCTSLSRQNGAQSLLEISCSDLTPNPQRGIDEKSSGCGGSTSSAKGDRDAETDTLWAQFLDNYPFDKLDAPAPAERVFRSMRRQDQRDAVKWLPDYLAHWKSRGRTARHVAMKKWLEERRWEGFTRDVPTAHGPSEDFGVGVRVYADTPEAEAWTRHLAAQGRKFIAITPDRKGLYALKKTRWPPRSEPRTNPYFDGLTGRAPYDNATKSPVVDDVCHIEGLGRSLKDAGNVAAELELIAERKGGR